MTRTLRGLLALLVLLPAWAACAGDLEVTDAWVRLPPPDSSAAAYLTLHNRGSEAHTLRSATSPCCARVEIHRSVESDGIARMEPAHDVVVPAGGSVVFAPRGLHLMLIGPPPLEAGAQVELELAFDAGEPLKFTAPVQKMPMSEHGEHHGH
jgi:hypothetical protein